MPISLKVFLPAGGVFRNVVALAPGWRGSAPDRWRPRASSCWRSARAGNRSRSRSPSFCARRWHARRAPAATSTQVITAAMIADVAGLSSPDSSMRGHSLAVTLRETLVASRSQSGPRVTLTLQSNGQFMLDVAQRSQLAAAAARDVCGRQCAGRTSRLAQRDARLAQLTSVFADRIVLFVDAHEVRAASVEYLRRRGGSGSGSGSGRPAGHFPIDRINAARRDALRWLYGLVADPYPLEIRQPDGSSTIEWIEGTNWSDVIDLLEELHPADASRDRAAVSVARLHAHPAERVSTTSCSCSASSCSARAGKTMLLQVTAFTVAHSITLGLSIYGIVSLPSRIVEPLIALSIAYVGDRKSPDARAQAVAPRAGVHVRPAARPRIRRRAARAGPAARGISDRAR